jgi:hypothetical protein
VKFIKVTQTFTEVPLCINSKRIDSISPHPYKYTKAKQVFEGVGTGISYCNTKAFSVVIESIEEVEKLING